MRSDFPTKVRITTAPIRPAWWTAKPGSSSMPTLTKKRRPKRSRMGTTSLSAWWLNSDSLRTRPATNAPSAKERPQSQVAYPTPTPIRDDGDEKKLARTPRGDELRSLGRSRVPRTTMAPRISTAIPIARPRLARRPPDAPSCGSTTSIGTTARSCTISRPIMTRLASVWVTPAADEHLQDDGGAGDGDHRAEPDRFAGRHAQRRRPRRGGERAGEQDLDGAADQRDTADGLEVAEGELEAEREEEECDADFG